jgi:hypothetical protein
MENNMQIIYAQFRKISLAFIILTSALMAGGASAQFNDYCEKPTSTRGAGVVPNACKDGDRGVDEGLCYKKCAAGWDGKGTNCVQNCPAGFRDDGLFCFKADSYSVATQTFPWKIGDKVGDDDKQFARCNQEHSGVGCEKQGLIVYPKCKTGFVKTGFTCAAACPANFKDIGISCAKPTTGRGVGTPVDSCASGMQMDAGLCYKNCADGMKGVGPVCWGVCASGMTDCGLGCATSAKQCALGPAKLIGGILIRAAMDMGKLAKLSADGAREQASQIGRNAAAALSGAGRVFTTAEIKETINSIVASKGKSLPEDVKEQLAKLVAGQQWDYKLLNADEIKQIFSNVAPDKCRT